MATRKVTVFTGADGNDYDVRDEAAQQSIATISNGIGSVPSGQTVEGQISALESGKVPTTRKVNNKALSSDITLVGTDIPVSSSDSTKVDSALASKVPNTRKVNNKALSSDVNLVGSDIPVSALDNTKLDVAITDLKSASKNDISLANKEILSDIQFFEQGGINALDGVTLLDSRSDLIRCVTYMPCKESFIYVPIGYDYVIIYYDKDKSYIGYKPWTASTGEVEMVDDPHDSSKYYFRANVSRHETGDLTPEIGAYCGKSSFISMFNKFYNKYELINGSTLQTNGVIANVLNRATFKNKISIQWVNISVASGYSYSLCLYNANKEPINYIGSWIETSITYKDIYDIRKDAYYMSLNIRRNDNDNISIAEAESAITINYLDTYDSIAKLASRCSDLQYVNNASFDFDSVKYNSIMLVSSNSTSSTPLANKTVLLETIPCLGGSASTNYVFQRITDVSSHGSQATRFYNGNWSDWKLVRAESNSPKMEIFYYLPALNKVALDSLRSRTTNQDIAVYNGNIIECDVGFLKINGGSSISASTGHGNNVQFGKTLHGDYPYLYCGSWDEDTCEIYVNQINSDSVTLVSTIQFDGLTGYLNMCVDEENGRFYIMLADDPYTGNITFIVSDLTGSIISRKQLTKQFPIIQGMEFYNGHIYMLSGTNSDQYPNKLTIFDTSGEIVSESDKLTPSNEVEGISFDRITNKLYIASINYIFT